MEKIEMSNARHGKMVIGQESALNLSPHRNHDYIVNFENVTPHNFGFFLFFKFTLPHTFLLKMHFRLIIT